MKFPAPIAYNVVPVAGKLVDDGPARPTRSRSSATSPARSSSCRSWPSPPRACVSPCTRGTHWRSTPSSRNRSRSRPPARRWQAAPGVVLSDLPTPLQAAGRDPSFVGRLRRDDAVPHGSACSWRVTTCARAPRSNAVEIAELLLAGRARRHRRRPPHPTIRFRRAGWRRLDGGLRLRTRLGTVAQTRASSSQASTRRIAGCRATSIVATVMPARREPPLGRVDRAQAGRSRTVASGRLEGVAASAPLGRSLPTGAGCTRLCVAHRRCRR